jgi:hypothetical protein
MAIYNFRIFPEEREIISLNNFNLLDSVMKDQRPTAAARVRTQVRSYRICGGQSDKATGVLQVLQFPLPIIIPPNSPSL